VTAVFVMAVSLAALAHSFISHCRTLLRAVANIQVSQNVRTLSGLDFGRTAMEAFSRLALLLQLCTPMTAERTRELRFVRLYCAFLKLAGLVPPPLLGRERIWLQREVAACAHFAAVALDERISRIRRFCEHSLPDTLRP
jgi:hypothetical protein